MGDIGTPELLIVIVVVVVLFGAKRLPDAARSLGRSLRIFKSEIKDLHDDDHPAPTAGEPAPAAVTPSPTPSASPSASVGDAVVKIAEPAPAEDTTVDGRAAGAR
ncbi:twin-arginine translocase TatA/TatE family subunit [Candidatus Frankia alpina]|uniref:Sec-independent protein translocase protein TatA n=1 Tax=Candidatus Frankia alpina TaxID=2699483 RepID=A0A4S5EK68_9ACTN|nr:Sec-independent protein translocase subunit TatA [Candidatus Frankia alpina]THJ72240.1 twin-arginine translocase TatA/TatE family subunit [Candidatus Frankia alpina]